MKLKRCVKCSNSLDSIEFSKDSSRKDGLSARCRTCDKEKVRKWQVDNPAAVNETNRRLKKKYPDRNKVSIRRSEYIKFWPHLSPSKRIDEYNRIFMEQEGRCRICSRHQSEFSVRLAVDHCHKTGKVRALLCRRCNVALGLLEENADLFVLSASYLKEHACLVWPIL